MPRRFREYLDRLSRRDTHREEPNTYTVNTTVNFNGYHPVSWNTTQWFPDNDTDMTAREIMEMAEAEATPENMLRLSMPNTLAEERSMDPPRDYWLSSATGIPTSYLDANWDPSDYREYRPSWSSNRTYTWDWGGKYKKFHGHVEYRRGKVILVKRYCKI